MIVWIRYYFIFWGKREIKIKVFVVGRLYFGGEIYNK